MRLLITTQAVDAQDPATSFFVGWVRSFAEQFENIEVVCLKEGEYSLPSNVRVHSLGKESERGVRFAKRIRYTLRFFAHAWRLRNEYHAVLVHMNQEYVLLGALLWKLLGKHVYMWRNHYAGSPLTGLAAALCTKVFCTSAHSYTARYKKTVLMPVGVDTDLYGPVAGVLRAPRSVLFYGRMAPSKRPDMLLEALRILHGRGVDFTASFYGSPLPKDVSYAESVKAKAAAFGLAEKVLFFPGQPHAEGPAIFSAHDVFVNLSKSGMYDKMIFEAAACECLVLAASDDFSHIVDKQFIFDEASAEGLADKIARLLALEHTERAQAAQAMRTVAEQNSLATLSRRLAEEIR